jgi:hypothetical protein
MQSYNGSFYAELFNVDPTADIQRWLWITTKARHLLSAYKFNTHDTFGTQIDYSIRKMNNFKNGRALE